MAVTARSPADRAVAISSAGGRCDAEPAPYRTARPMARPASSVIRMESPVMFRTASCTTAYTPIARLSAFRQPGRPVSPTIVMKATRPTR